MKTVVSVHNPDINYARQVYCNSLQDIIKPIYIFLYFLYNLGFNVQATSGLVEGGHGMDYTLAFIITIMKFMKFMKIM